MKNFARVNCVVLFILLVVSIFQPAAYCDYPEAKENYVNDYAGILSASDAAKIREQFKNLEEKDNVEMTVVIINSFREYNTNDTEFKPFVTNLFNRWGVGNKYRNNGVMLIAAIKDRKLGIEIDAGYDASFNDVCQKIINDSIVPEFKQGNISKGIMNGVDAIVAKVAAIPSENPVPETAPATPVIQENLPENPAVENVLPENPAPQQPPMAQPPVNMPVQNAYPQREQMPLPQHFSGNHYPRSTNYYGHARFSGIIFMIGVFGFGFLGILLIIKISRIYSRNRQRFCPKCNAPMKRLDEAADDMYLDSGQQLEEYLKSVDYDVWKCPVCSTHEIFPYNRFFSGYQVCPKCRRKTVSVSSHILEAPTRYTAGRKQVIRDCRNCNFSDTDIVYLPKLPDDTDHHSSFGSGSSFSSGSSFGSHSSGSSSSGSGSGSSFGRGSSSGGGATGSW